jgi:3-deoxy-D-manno-octulosonic-acid transferase
MSMLRVVYNLAFSLAFFLYIPKILGMCFLRKNALSVLLYKLGLKQQVFSSHLQKTIWIHAVSLGEVKAAYPLILHISKNSPDKIILTCTTQAGMDQALQYKPWIEDALYLPFDFHLLVKKMISRINPSIFIMIEADLWPELLCCLKAKQVPTLLVNGKISEKSFKRYSSVLFYTHWLLKYIDVIAAQSHHYADLWVKLGGADKVVVTGNMKFEYPMERSTLDQQMELKKRFCFSKEDKLIVIASTHPQEEEHLLNALETFIKNQPHNKIILVPRHVHRCEQIACMLEKKNYLFAKYSSPGPCQILLVDQMGVLLKFYEIAHVAIVGGSFENIGGHNILEPLFYGVPTFFGPFMHQQKQLRELCVKEGICQESSYETIAQDITQALHRESFQTQDYINKIFASHQGSAQKNWSLAKKLLNSLE